MIVHEDSQEAFEKNVAALCSQGFSESQAAMVANRVRRDASKPDTRIATFAERPPVGPVPQEALDYFESKRLVFRGPFDTQEAWGQENILGFGVAGVMEQDLLRDIQSSITRALAQGQTFETWRKGLNETLDTSGWTAFDPIRERPHRLYTIYQTNMRAARSVGQWERIQATKATQPFLEYLLGPSEVHRPGHELFAGTIAAVDDPIWQTWMPTNGHGCKCHVRQLSERALERRGGLNPPPEGVLPDEGFRTNTAVERQNLLRTLEAQV